ncbi:hypothetical protein [Clostridium sp. AN503]|uniref:hypothetical protein n=1 Tax=Clostridium sp. AN503 TaxID=3160598 RepID=UPI003458D7F8
MKKYKWRLESRKKFEFNFQKHIMIFSRFNMMRNRGKEIFYGKLNDDKFFFFYYDASKLFPLELVNQMIVPTTVYGKIKEDENGSYIEYYIGKKKSARNLILLACSFLGICTSFCFISKEKDIIGFIMICLLWCWTVSFLIKPKKEIMRCKKMLEVLTKS